VRKTVLAPEHNKIACRDVFAAPVVVVSVTSASVLRVVVPAMAESSNAVISVLTVLPHVPDSSPVTGKAKPKSDVYAVAIFYLKLQLLPNLGFEHLKCSPSREFADC